MNCKHLSRGALTKIVLGAILLALFVLTSGCAAGPEGSYKFGRASRNIFAAQVVNWAAPHDPAPVEGMPGIVSEGIYLNRYMKEIVEEKDEEEESDVTGRFSFNN